MEDRSIPAAVRISASGTPIAASRQTAGNIVDITINLLNNGHLGQFVGCEYFFRIIGAAVITNGDGERIGHQAGGVQQLRNAFGRHGDSGTAVVRRIARLPCLRQLIGAAAVQGNGQAVDILAVIYADSFANGALAKAKTESVRRAHLGRVGRGFKAAFIADQGQ